MFKLSWANSFAMSRHLRDLAERHYKKALSLMQKGKTEEALKTLVIAEEIAQKTEAFDILLPIMNIKGELLLSLGSLDEVLRVCGFASNFFSDILSKDPEDEFCKQSLQMNLNNIGTVGNFYGNAGRFPQAKNAYETGLGISLKLLHSLPQNEFLQNYTGGMLNNLGSLLSYMGQIEEAKAKYEKALENYEKLLKNDLENAVYQSNVAMTFNNLGNLFLTLGRIKEAKKKYEKTLEIRKKLLMGDPENVTYQSDLAMALNNLGNLLWTMGRIKEAKERYEKALEIYEKLFNNDPENAAYQSDVAMTLNNLGILLRNIGNIEESKERYEKALDIYKKLLNNDPENVAYQSYIGTALNNLGNLLSDMWNIEEAKERYEKALKMRKKLLNNDPENIAYQSDVAMTLNNLGSLFSYMGRIGEAKERYEKALEMRKKLLKNDPENVVYRSNVAMTLNNLGNLFSDMGRIKEAKKKYEKALEMREKLLKNDPENVAYQSDVAMTLNNFGSRLQKENSYSTALDFHLRALDLVSSSASLDTLFKTYELLGGCYEKLCDYNQAFTSYKKSIECIESIRSQFSIEEIKMDIMWDKGAAYTDMISLLCTRMDDSEKAWEYLGRFKSRALLDSLRFLEFDAPENVPEELLKQEESLMASIRIFNRQIRKSEKADETSQLTRKIKEKETELNEVYDRIQEFSPEYVDLRKGQPLGIKEIRELIGNQEKKTAFVEYYTTAEKVYIFVMRSDKKNTRVETADFSSKKLLDYVYSYHMEIIEIPGIEETWQELSEKLIEPIFNYIDGCELVYLIPHDLLHYLPLHALLVKDKRCEKKKRLIEYFPIVYAPNLTALKYSQKKNYQYLKPCLSLGYTPHDYQKELFEGEATLVARQFNVEPILGDRAKSEVLKNVNSEVIHASCHGGFNPADPLKSGICLRDGMLTAREIFEMDIKTNLLVLSACQTGLNSRKPGDELVGLTRAFLYAGTRSLIVSLWSVEARSTYEYMKNFYQDVKKGENKAKALQKIQVDFINGKYGDIYTHPYFWAPFVLIGDWKGGFKDGY